MKTLRSKLAVPSVALALMACATAPSRVSEDGAIEAAKQLVASKREWASQATYVAQGRGPERVVVVSCSPCRNADGSPVSAELVVLVNRAGVASFLVGLE